MNMKLEGACPICAKSFPRAQLHAHIIAERPAIRRQIMQSIQAQYPNWTHVNGICQSCWNSYRQEQQVGETR